MRGKHSEKSPHWKEEYLKDRAYFRTATEPASLNINHIDDKDEGEYRCRVDFTKSPTRNSRIQLVIIGELIFKRFFFCIFKKNISKEYYNKIPKEYYNTIPKNIPKN